MAYKRTVWENGVTPINAANLNNIENGIVNLDEIAENALKNPKTTAEARQNINFIGTNPIASAEDDTPENWAKLGSGFAYINANVLNNQPTTYCFVENKVYTGTDGGGMLIVQTLYALGGNTKAESYSRAGNANGWYAASANWVKQLDEKTGIQHVNAWTNASPTSTFKGQTITAQQMGLTDLSPYDIALVAFNYHNATEQQPPIAMFKKGKTTRYKELWDPHYMYFRSVAFNNDGVTFGDAYYGKLLQNNSVDNTCLIPVEIYLVKGVQ